MSTTAKATEPTAYDKIPYQGSSYPGTHPNQLATVATIFNLNPTPTDRCRVLELGCAAGGNLLPMAEALPESSFVGIDLSSRQVDSGLQAIKTLGLKNIELRHASILDVDESYGLFDYILCHGVYSWVPPEVQDAILKICSTRMAPNGIACVSYNTFPGWHMRSMIRNMMQYHTKKFSDDKKKIEQARNLVEFLHKAVSSQDDAYSRMLKAESEMLRKQTDANMFHELLEEYNEPLYFHQFMERASEHQLQFLSESDISASSVDGFSEEVRKNLDAAASGIVEMEQYLDFLRNRTFRQSLLCHQSTEINRKIKLQCIQHLFVSCNFETKQKEIDLRANDLVEYIIEKRGTIKTNQPAAKAALAHLKEIWPATISFRELLQVVDQKLNSNLPDGTQTIQIDPHALGFFLLKGFTSRTIELSVQPSSFATQVGKQPATFPLVLLQSRAGNRVTNRKHQTIRLNELERIIMQQLDGSHTLDELAEILSEQVAKGVITIQSSDQKSGQGPETKQVMAQYVNELLPKLAKQSFLKQ